MTKVITDSGAEREYQYQVLHVIQNDEDTHYIEGFFLSRTPVYTMPDGQHMHNILGVSQVTYDPAKAPWSTQKYKNMVQNMRDVLALCASGYFHPGEFF